VAIAGAPMKILSSPRPEQRPWSIPYDPYGKTLWTPLPARARPLSFRKSCSLAGAAMEWRAYILAAAGAAGMAGWVPQLRAELKVSPLRVIGTAIRVGYAA